MTLADALATIRTVPKVNGVEPDVAATPIVRVGSVAAGVAALVHGLESSGQVHDHAAVHFSGSLSVVVYL